MGIEGVVVCGCEVYFKNVLRMQAGYGVLRWVHEFQERHGRVLKVGLVEVVTRSGYAHLEAHGLQPVSSAST